MSSRRVLLKLTVQTNFEGSKTWFQGSNESPAGITHESFESKWWVKSPFLKDWPSHTHTRSYATYWQINLTLSQVQMTDKFKWISCNEGGKIGGHNPSKLKQTLSQHNWDSNELFDWHVLLDISMSDTCNLTFSLPPGLGDWPLVKQGNINESSSQAFISVNIRIELWEIGN